MPRKPPVVWYPAHPNNYTAANRPNSHRIDRIVIHVTQGSWSGAVNWFQNPNAGVSAHYTVRSSDGKIAQSVSDINIAYHAGQWPYNVHSIGIEHEGFVSDPKWFTPEMYRSSARLLAYLCRRYRIPIDRQHVIGHNEVPGCPSEGGGVGCHTDPGRWWWWSYYMKHARRFART
jgi:N-acetyl-anhydromuramyl-L-alanine amidase AmpD